MSPRLNIPPGTRFDRLVIIGQWPITDKRGYTKFECRCDCGNAAVVLGSNLKSGNTKSCGCLEVENRITHGLSKTREWHIWTGMHGRCNATTGKAFRWYGSRGITVDRRWDTFDQFYKDMGPRPSRRHSIERVDNDKGYSPENCVWALPKRQLRNTRRNTLITFNGRTLCMAAWAEELGVKPKSLRQRFKLGWSVEKMLTTPMGPAPSTVTHCPKGHPYIPENTYFKKTKYGTGKSRMCRTCRLAAAARAWRHRKGSDT